MQTNIRLAIVDDHTLIRKSMVELLRGPRISVVGEYKNGRDFLDNAPLDQLDIVLMDYTMPVMNGVDCCQELLALGSAVRVLALSMNEDELSITSMIRAGARGYVTKNSDMDELLRAVESVVYHGFYFSELVSPQFALSATEKGRQDLVNHSILSQRERDFLILCCSEWTYKEIAEKMIVSVRTVDGYREALFSKLGIKNRVGLVLYAIKMGIYKVSPLSHS